jgi:ABC-2 type transport system ATP-binding protein
MAAICTRGLAKDYRVGFWGRRQSVLRDLSLDIPEGEVFGYVGPNGAGKSTTIKLLLGLVQPTAGTASVLGYPAGDARARRQIGFLPENPSFYEYLTGHELLRYYGQLLGVDRPRLVQQARHLLDEVGLSHAATQQIRKYSKGMVQRLGLAQALLGEPRVLILDEPMSGLDPIGRKEVRDLILRQKDLGRTVFFSTHILPDIEVLCDRVGILVNGCLRDVGRLDEILKTQIESIELTARAVPAGLIPSLEALALAPLLRQPDGVLVRLPDEARLDEAIRAILAAGAQVVSVAPQRQTLEEHFLREVQGVER